MARKSKAQGGQHKLVPRLRTDESVIVVAKPSRVARLPRYLLSLGFYGFWRKRDTCVVTDRRMLLGRGMFNRKERSIPIPRVNDVSYVRRWLACYSDVLIDTKRGQELVRIGPLSCRNARLFTSELQDRI